MTRKNVICCKKRGLKPSNLFDISVELSKLAVKLLYLRFDYPDI